MNKKQFESIMANSKKKQVSKIVTTREPMPEWVKFFNLKRISDSLNIQSDKLYNNFRGFYNSLEGDRDKIASLMKPNVKELFKKLGWNVTFEKIDK